MIIDDKQESRRAGWRIFGYFLAGFIIVAGVNTIFIYKAVTTHTGEVTDSSYERGLTYNKTLDQAAALKNSEIAEELALPPVKIHCSILAEDAIKAAVNDYRQKHNLSQTH